MQTRPRPRLVHGVAAMVAAVTMAAGGSWAGQTPSERAELRVEARLSEPITVNFRGTPLDSVLDRLRDLTGVNFDVRWRRLEEAGVARDTPVEMILRDVPASVVLRRVLEQVGNEFDPIGYSIQGPVVTTSTRRELSRQMVVRTYDATGVLMPIRDFDNAPELNLNAVLNASRGEGVTDLISEQEEPRDVADERAERVRQLIDLIRRTVLDRE